MAFFKSEVIQGVFAPLIRVFLIATCLFATSVNRVFHISTAGSTSPLKSTIFQSVSFRSLIKRTLIVLAIRTVFNCLLWGFGDTRFHSAVHNRVIADCGMCNTTLNNAVGVIYKDQINSRSCLFTILVGELINCSRSLAINIANCRNCLLNLNEASFFLAKKSILKSPNKTI